MNYRRAIPVAGRLAVTLRSLATRDSYSPLVYVFKISKQVISKILPDVCKAISEVLHEHVKVSSYLSIFCKINFINATIRWDEDEEAGYKVH